MDIRYNVRICGKQYKNKTVDQILELLERYENELNKNCRVSVLYIKSEVKYIKHTVSRSAYYGHDNKIIFSINKCK